MQVRHLVLGLLMRFDFTDSTDSLSNYDTFNDDWTEPHPVPHLELSVAGLFALRLSLVEM